MLVAGDKRLSAPSQSWSACDFDGSDVRIYTRELRNCVLQLSSPLSLFLSSHT